MAMRVQPKGYDVGCMKPKCEVCHENEATGTKWLTVEESPIRVAGVYRVCPKHGGPKDERPHA